MSSQDVENKTLVITRPGSDEIILVVGLVLEARGLDIEELLSALVPEMARGGVKGGLLVVGDSTLVLRLEDAEVSVDEVDTASLLALADIEEHFDREHALEMMMRWITVLRQNWRDRVVGRLRDLLVPHIVAGLSGDVEVAEGIWGTQAHRVARRI
jgi:hypothetical protein